MILLAALAALTWPAVIAAQTPGSEDDGVVPTAPVTLDGVTLFSVRGVSSFSPQVRAGLIEERIETVAGDRSIPIDSLHLVAGPEAVRVMAGPTLLMAVTDADARTEQVSKNDLATAHLLQLRSAIAAYRYARTPQALRGSAARTGLATLLLIVSLVLLAWVWRRVDALLVSRLEARIQSVGIQSFEVMRAERIRAALASTLRGLKTLTVAAILLVYVGYVLGQWPWTRPASLNAAAFAAAPLQVLGRGLLANVPKLVFLVVLYVIVRAVLRIVRLFFEAVERGSVTLRQFDPEWAQPTYKIVRIGIVAFALVVAYPYIPGSQSEAFKGVSLFIGIVFSLGSSSAISNIIAGYMMTYRRAFKVGDRVKIGEAVGDVIEMRLQVTHLRSFKNEEIVIPNSEILGGQVLNYSSLARVSPLLLHTRVAIGYERPWRQVEALLREAASRTSGLAAAAPPFVLLKSLGEFSIVYELNVPCDQPQNMNALYTALHKNVLDVFNEYGVQIMVPAYEGDPPEPKVVPPAGWYAAPAAEAPGPPPGTTAGLPSRNAV
jgi:small-conductance mechanosensitive channel